MKQTVYFKLHNQPTASTQSFIYQSESECILAQVWIGLTKKVVGINYYLDTKYKAATYYMPIVNLCALFNIFFLSI